MRQARSAPADPPSALAGSVAKSEMTGMTSGHISDYERCRGVVLGGVEVRADKCACPFHVDGILREQRPRRPLKTRSTYRWTALRSGFYYLPVGSDTAPGVPSAPYLYSQFQSSQRSRLNEVVRSRALV